MNKLSLKGKIAMVIVAPLLLIISTGVFGMLYLFKFIFWIFTKSGITEAMNHLLAKLKDKNQMDEFMSTLSDLDKKTMRNG